MKFAKIEIETLDYHAVAIDRRNPLPNYWYPDGMVEPFTMYAMQDREFYIFNLHNELFNSRTGKIYFDCDSNIEKQTGRTTLFKKI